MGSAGKWLMRIPEPVILLYMFAAMMETPVMEQYVYQQYSEEKGLVYQYNGDKSSCGGHLNATQNKIQDEVQELTARFNIIQSFCVTIPTIFSCLFYGALSDKIGRRPIMIISCIGACIDGGVMLSTMFFQLPLYSIFIGAVFNGLGGGFTGIFMMSYAYLADVTETEKLPIRMAILSASSGIGLCLSNFASGPLIKQYSFTKPQILITSSYLAGALYILLVLKESLHGTSTKEAEVNFHEVKKIHRQPKILWGVVSKPRPQRWALYLSMSILVISTFFTIGVVAVITLYFINRPFCWPALEIGYYLGTQMVMISVGTIVGLKLFLLFLPQYCVATLSFGFCMASYIMIGFAQDKGFAYGALVVLGFGVMQAPIYRATISKIVDPTEQGSIFSVISALEMLFAFAGSFVFNTAYSKLNDLEKPHYFFFVPAGLTLIPMALSIIFWTCWVTSSKRSGSWAPINTDERDIRS